MDTVSTAQESEAEADPNVSEGSKAASVSSQGSRESVEPQDVSIHGHSSDKVDRIKMLDRPNRQPTVEDFDSDSELRSNRPRHTPTYWTPHEVEKSESHAHKAWASSPSLSLKSHAPSTDELNVSPGLHGDKARKKTSGSSSVYEHGTDVRRSRRIRAEDGWVRPEGSLRTRYTNQRKDRDATSESTKGGAFSRNRSRTGSIIEETSSSKDRDRSDRHDRPTRIPQTLTRQRSKWPSGLSNSPSRSDQSSMQAQQSFTDTSSDNYSLRMSGPNLASDLGEPLDGDQSRTPSLSGGSDAESHTESRILGYSSEQYYISEMDEPGDSWSLIEEESALNPLVSPGYSTRRQRRPRLRRRRAPSIASRESAYDDYSSFSQPSRAPGARPIVPSAPLPGLDPFYDAYPQYASNPYPYSDLDTRMYGQPSFPGYGGSIPATPPPPSPNLSRAPVLPELRALLVPLKARPKTRSGPADLPPEVPNAPFAESYGSDDDSRTVTSGPVNTPSHTKKIDNSSTSSQDAVLGLYLDGTAEVDPAHLAQLRFGSNVPLHLTAISSNTWPESSSSGNEVGHNHTYQRYDAITARRLRRGDGRQSIELECRQGPPLQSPDTESHMEWLHIQSDCMSLEVLQNYCLSAPNITQELQHVVARLFEKINKTHCRQYFDGYLLNPGVVLRWDGSTPGYKKGPNLTASFSCFPFLDLQSRNTDSRHKQEGFPSRSVLQTLYPYDSTSNRDMPPSFSRVAPSAADKVMLVSQVWCVSIGHKCLVTYTQLSVEELREDTVLIKKQEPVPEGLAEDCQVDGVKPQHPLKRTTESINNTQGPDTVHVLRLFEGKRVEDFEVTEFAEAHEEVPLPTTPRKASTWHVSPHTGQRATITSLQGQAEGDQVFTSDAGLEQTTISQPVRRRSVGSLPTQVSHGQWPSAIPTDPKKPSLDDLKSMSFLLSTMDEPEMTTEYMQIFKTCMNSLLSAWPDIFLEGPATYVDELEKVQLSLQTAEKLDKVLMLEEGNLKLAAKPEYRMSLMKILGLQSVEQELNTLAKTATMVVRLLRDNGTEDARKIFADIRFEESDSAERGLEDLKNMARRSFLAWPWILSDAAEFTNDPQEAARSLARNFAMILDDSDEHIKRRNDKLSYLKAEQKSLADLEQLMHTLGVVSPTPAREPPGSTPTEFRETPGVRLVSDNDTRIAERRETTVSLIQSLIRATQDLVGLFVPCESSHPMLEKIWGSLASLSQIMMRSFEPDDDQLHSSCVVRRSNDSSNSSPDLLPSLSIDDCSTCRSGRIYNTVTEAITHLKTNHFRSVYVSDNYLRNYWTRNADAVRRHWTNHHHLRLVELYIDYLTMLLERAKAIHERTAHRGDGDAGCTLPRGLVECFETITLFTVQISTIAFGIREEIECMDSLPAGNLDLRMNDYALTRLGHLGKTAQRAMSRAETALIRSDPTAIVELGPAGPDLLIAVMLHNVQKRALLPDDERRNYALYHNYASRLVYQINQFPRRRLLHDIQVLQEELDIVRRVNHWQHECIANLDILLDPRYFLRPTKARNSMYPAEHAALQRTLESLDVESGELEALDHRVHDLRNQLRQSVEILEEDHGKAIFVFTMVTTIFLPLSFVSSFFGMNFADIRDMEKQQGLFWATALPVTAGIIVIAVFLANHGDKVLEMIIRTLQGFKRQEQQSSMVAVSESEKNPWNSSSTILPQPLGMQRRRGFSLRH